MNSKVEMLSTLLTIRAGMSVVSNENYKARKMIEIAREINDELLNRVKTESKTNILQSEYPRMEQTKQWIEQNEKAAIKHSFFHFNAGLTLSSVMENTYSSFLNCRDWQEVDLIIYYLQNERAKTLNDALEIIENDRQSKTNIEAFDFASQNVNKLICENLNGIEDVLRDSFINLAENVNKQAHCLNFDLNTICECIDPVNQYLSVIISEENMNKALREMSHTPSKLLYGDLLQLQENIEQIKKYKRNAIK